MIGYGAMSSWTESSFTRQTQGVCAPLRGAPKPIKTCPSVTETEPLLARVPLFSSLPSEEIKRLTNTLRTVEVPPQTVLFYEGESGDHFYIVREGEIEILKGLGTPDMRFVGIRRPGDFVGEMSLLNSEGKRTASVRSLGYVRLWEMNRPEFDALLLRHPFLAYEMVRVLSGRLTNAHNSAIADLTQKNHELQQAYEELKAAQAQIIEKEKLERELQLAYEIQMSILPRILPELTGFDFGARIVPARAVGGDLYDFIPLHNQALGIVIGDVSDKGVPAAIFMAQCHALIRSEGQRSSSPHETLKRVNHHLLGMNASGLFVTVLYGVLDATTHEFHYARAGHELPLIRTPEGQVISPPHGPGAPLGILDHVILDEGQVELPPGSTMLLITDGVTEARQGEKDEFGIERVRQELAAHLDLNAQALCDELLNTIGAFRGDTPPHDDVTMVAIRSGE